MIDLDLYMSLINGGVMLFCLVIGYIIKTSIPKIPNRYIPLIMGIVGMLVAIVNAQSYDFNVILSGLITGLASTGLYEAYRNLINKDEK
jgi:ABC-type thiamin/hydroxymethylpyrimidine transport system permease subunit